MEPDVLRLTTDELGDARTTALRRLLDEAFGVLSDEDWQHALGGTHFLIEEDGSPVAHASVVTRRLGVGGVELGTGYVEAVAAKPSRQRRGLGTAVMRAAAALILDHHELGALGTGEHGFYERLGWETWDGPTGLRTTGGIEPTPEEDGYVMILRTATTPMLEPGTMITCEWRVGDVW